MIRKLSSGEYRLYSRKKNPQTGNVEIWARLPRAGRRKSTSGKCNISSGTSVGCHQTERTGGVAWRCHHAMAHGRRTAEKLYSQSQQAGHFGDAGHEMGMTERAELFGGVRAAGDADDHAAAG